MCLGALDLQKVQKIRSHLQAAITDLVQNHRNVLCRDPSRDFVRSRDFTPEKIFSTLLQFGSKSTESELIDILNCEGTGRNINAAFLAQRAKLGDDCLPFLFRSFTESISSDPLLSTSAAWLHGYHVFATDGSDVNIAYNPNDPLTYIPQKDKRGYNQIHLNAMLDTSSGMWMAASIQGIHRKQERRAFIEMLSQLKAPQKAILTADRGYESFNVFAACKEKSAKFVVRLKDIDSNGILSAYDLNDGEFDTYIHTKLTKSHAKEFMEHPETYTVLSEKTDFDFFEDDGSYEIWLRIVRFRLPNGEYMAVATNLDEDEFDIHAIAAIYHLRWDCEVAFRKLKHTLGLVNLHSWKMKYIKQEVFARLIVYNFTAAIINAIRPRNLDKTPESEDTQAQEHTAPKPQVKKRGVAFSQAVTVCRKLVQACTVAFVRNAITTIKAHVYVSKTGRSYPRKIKPQSYTPFCHKAS